jgi:ketosteroid isomerase-like protein
VGDRVGEPPDRPEEFIDAGEHVVVTVRYSARGRARGIEFNDRLFDVYTLRDGQCVRKLEFREQSHALVQGAIPRV